MAPLDSIRACLFDAYGTLFDVGSALAGPRARLGDAAEQVSATWRAKQLEYTWLRTLMGRHADFWQVTSDALDFAFDEAGIDDPDLHAKLLDGYLRLAPYPEVPAALQQLTEAGVRCAILSNGSPAMLEAGTRHAGLQPWLEALLSVETAGRFKPDPAVYELGARHFGLPPSEICFLSSNAWDVAGAASAGLRVIWINRFDRRPERLPAGPEATIRSLDELPTLLGL